NSKNPIPCPRPAARTAWRRRGHYGCGWQTASVRYRTNWRLSLTARTCRVVVRVNSRVFVRIFVFTFGMSRDRVFDATASPAIARERPQTVHDRGARESTLSARGGLLAFFFHTSL